MAKFLEVNPNRGEKKSVTQDDINNKMLEGTRADQRDETARPVRRPTMQTPAKVLRLAAEMNVDLAKVDPTGSDGRQITEDDVRKAADDPTKLLPGGAKVTDTRAARTDAERNRSSTPGSTPQSTSNTPKTGTPTGTSNSNT